MFSAVHIFSRLLHLFHSLKYGGWVGVGFNCDIIELLFNKWIECFSVRGIGVQVNMNSASSKTNTEKQNG